MEPRRSFGLWLLDVFGYAVFDDFLSNGGGEMGDYTFLIVFTVYIVVISAGFELADLWRARRAQRRGGR